MTPKEIQQEAERVYPMSMIGGGIDKTSRQLQQNAFIKGAGFASSSAPQCVSVEVLNRIKEMKESALNESEVARINGRDSAGADGMYVGISMVEKLLLPNPPKETTKICHICGGENTHTPDCTSFPYGITNGLNI